MAIIVNHNHDRVKKKIRRSNNICVNCIWGEHSFNDTNVHVRCLFPSCFKAKNKKYEVKLSDKVKTQLREQRKKGED